MKVEYKEWKQNARIVDTDEFWLKWLSEGLVQAEKNWYDHIENLEPYCYGRNNNYKALYDSETYPLKLDYTIVPKEVWNTPNEIFSKLMKFKDKKL